MKHLKTFGVIAVCSIAMPGLAASGASATTFEIGGVTQNGSVTVTASLKSGTKAKWTRTSGTIINECAKSHAHGATTSPFTGSQVTAPLSTLTFEDCLYSVTVHKPGQLYFRHILGTTDGTLYSENTEITVKEASGFYVTCLTGTETDIGQITGKASGHATLDIHAVLSCGFLQPSVTYSAEYEVTTPTGLGVSA